MQSIRGIGAALFREGFVFRVKSFELLSFDTKTQGNKWKILQKQVLTFFWNSHLCVLKNFFTLLTKLSKLRRSIVDNVDKSCANQSVLNLYNLLTTNLYLILLIILISTEKRSNCIICSELLTCSFPHQSNNTKAHITNGRKSSACVLWVV